MAGVPHNPFNPRMAEGVRHHGFRKWYERELLSSHVHMALAVLCAIALMGTLEAFGGGTTAEKVLGTILFILSAAIGLWALRRYLGLLMHAEEVANQASCPGCGLYARFDVLSEDRHNARTSVRCRHCAREWEIDA